MTQPQSELKACPNPSCNSDNVDLMSISMGECNWTVGCNECAMTGPQAFTTVQAATGWNLLPRSSPQVAPGLRDDAARSIKEFELWVESKGYARKNGDFDLSPYSGQLDGPRYKSYLTESWFEIWTASRAADTAAAQAQSSAPPSLRDAIRLAIAEDDPDKYPNMYRADNDEMHAGLSNQSIDRCADIAYATVVNQQPVAAAQGGQVVDLSTLTPADLNLIHISLLDSSSNRDPVNAYQVNLFNRQHEVADKIEAMMKGNSAVPSAPGAERVKELWKLIEPWCTVEGNEQTIRRFDKFCAEMDALGTPQGSDSLRLDWLEKTHADIESPLGMDKTWLLKYDWDETDCEYRKEYDRKTLRAAIDSAMAAGEAKERGENE